jgi:3',5'-cyclic AMP phosphodiesterase CpdA
VSWNLLRAERPDAPLLRGLVIDHPDGPRFPLPGHPRGIAATQTFSQFQGWEVHLWSDPQIRYRDAVILEAAHGAGRIVLVAIPLDKLIRRDGSAAVADPYPLAASTFAANLYDYVLAAQARALPPPSVTSPDAEPPYGFSDGSWSLVVLPDSQYAVLEAPEVLEAQLDWIADSHHRLGIRFVVHEGDVTHTGHRREWRRARRAFDAIEGVVPYAVTTGNHDYDPHAPLSARETGFSAYFGADVARSQPTFGGLLSEERPENQYHRFEAGGTSWLVITLEYLPSRDAVEWADGVIRRAPNDEVILVTHAFLDELDGRIDLDQRLRAVGRPALPCEYHDGQDLWRELVSGHPSIRLVFSGHVTGDGAGRRHDLVAGRPVHQVMANYQMRRDGGQGWLRVVEFLADRRTVRVHTYSPWLDRFMTGSQHQFQLDLGAAPGTTDDR